MAVVVFYVATWENLIFLPKHGRECNWSVRPFKPEQDLQSYFQSQRTGFIGVQLYGWDSL